MNSIQAFFELDSEGKVLPRKTPPAWGAGYRQWVSNKFDKVRDDYHKSRVKTLDKAFGAERPKGYRRRGDYYGL
jgi:hypothetical protein